MNKSYNGYRIIGKCKDMYMVTDDPTANLSSTMNKACVIDTSGKALTTMLPINFLLRVEEEYVWEPTSGIFQMDKDSNHSLVEDGLLGFAVGDALGVPVEFLQKDEIRNIQVNEMMGKDTGLSFRSRWGDLIPAGAWSDDTSMIVATMDSMDQRNEIDYDHIVRSYLDWVNNAKYSSLSFAFGLGGTVYDALNRYCNGAQALQSGGTGIRDNGNGALMRILPFSLYCIENNLSEKETAELVGKGSQITHGHDISKMSCFIYTEFLKSIVQDKDPELALKHIQGIDYSKYFSKEAIKAHERILSPDFKDLPDKDINGSGYVVASLECSLYSILHSHNYEEAVKMAINTGYDTDTIAGITGSIAGIQYGVDSIPKRWISKLRKKNYLESIAEHFNEFLLRTKKEKKNLEEMLDEEIEIENNSKSNLRNRK